MNNVDLEFGKSFKKIGEIRSPDFLVSKILTRINQERVKTIKFRAIILRTVGLVSFAALFPAVVGLVAQLQASGFWNYLSLLFTDTGAVAVYWREFSLSILEALPLFGLTLIITLVLAIFISLRFINVNFKKYEFKF